MSVQFLIFLLICANAAYGQPSYTIVPTCVGVSNRSACLSSTLGSNPNGNIVGRCQWCNFTASSGNYCTNFYHNDSKNDNCPPCSAYQTYQSCSNSYSPTQGILCGWCAQYSNGPYCSDQLRNGNLAPNAKCPSCHVYTQPFSCMGATNVNSGYNPSFGPDGVACRWCHNTNEWHGQGQWCYSPSMDANNVPSTCPICSNYTSSSACSSSVGPGYEGQCFWCTASATCKPSRRDANYTQPERIFNPQTAKLMLLAPSMFGDHPNPHCDCEVLNWTQCSMSSYNAQSRCTWCGYSDDTTGYQCTARSSTGERRNQFCPACANITSQTVCVSGLIRGCQWCNQSAQNGSYCFANKCPSCHQYTNKTTCVNAITPSVNAQCQWCGGEAHLGNFCYSLNEPNAACPQCKAITNSSLCYGQGPTGDFCVPCTTYGTNSACTSAQNPNHQCPSCTHYASSWICSLSVDASATKCHWCRPTQQNGPYCMSIGGKGNYSQCPASCRDETSSGRCSSRRTSSGAQCYWCGRSDCVDCCYESCPSCSVYGNSTMCKSRGCNWCSEVETQGDFCYPPNGCPRCTTITTKSACQVARRENYYSTCTWCCGNVSQGQCCASLASYESCGSGVSTNP